MEVNSKDFLEHFLEFGLRRLVNALFIFVILMAMMIPEVVGIIIFAMCVCQSADRNHHFELFSSAQICNVQCAHLTL